MCLPWIGGAAERSFIEEFHDSEKIEKIDPDGAYAGMMRSYDLAVAAGNVNYATSAGLMACFILHKKEKVVESGKLARRVLDGIAPLATDFKMNDAVRRAQLFGFVETGLLMEGKVGLAWRANRATAEILRGKNVASSADGRPILLKECVELDPAFGGLGWRLIEKESELLDIVGRSNEARVLLDEAAARFNEHWRDLPANERFYAFKLLASRARLLDFLGYNEEAIHLQQDLETTGEGDSGLGSSYLVLRLNLLRDLSQWHGPSEERLAMAREIAGRLKASGINRDVTRTLAKMELDLRDSKVATDALQSNAKQIANLGHMYDALFADRDFLIAQAKQGVEGLDAEFNRLLDVARAQGRKRSEPTLYCEYGNYLVGRARLAEAITMFTEALRLTRSFGWVLHEPALLGRIADARWVAGDVAGTRATLAELEAWIQAHADAPAGRRALAEQIRAVVLVRLGDVDAAKASFERARGIARSLPDFQKRFLTPEAEAAMMKSESSAGPAAALVRELPALRVQPLEVVSVAVPGDVARTQFSVFNSTGFRIMGQWKIQGPGATIEGKAIGLDAGKAVTAVVMPQSIGAGDVSGLAVSISAAAGVDAASVSVAWEHAGQSAGDAATWSVSWNRAATGSVVLDASCIESSQFRYVTLFHELAVPMGEDFGIPFRLRSKVPLRFEYYDTQSQQLLAIDANGNGDFSEAGDLYLSGSAGLAAAMVPVRSGDRARTVEVHIFVTDGQSLPPDKQPLVLEAEVCRQGSWVKEAEDTLK